MVRTRDAGSIEHVVRTGGGKRKTTDSEERNSMVPSMEALRAFVDGSAVIPYFAEVFELFKCSHDDGPSSLLE